MPVTLKLFLTDAELKGVRGKFLVPHVVAPLTYAMEGTMKVEQSNLLAITSILDRSGRRVANYIVDRSKDSLEREKQRSSAQSEEAVVINRSDSVDAVEKPLTEPERKFEVSSLLNITA